MHAVAGQCGGCIAGDLPAAIPRSRSCRRSAPARCHQRPEVLHRARASGNEARSSYMTYAPEMHLRVYLHQCMQAMGDCMTKPLDRFKLPITRPSAAHLPDQSSTQTKKDGGSRLLLDHTANMQPTFEPLRPSHVTDPRRNSEQSQPAGHSHALPRVRFSELVRASPPI
jgi:hypothetical protein